MAQTTPHSTRMLTGLLWALGGGREPQGSHDTNVPGHHTTALLAMSLLLFGVSSVASAEVHQDAPPTAQQTLNSGAAGPVRLGMRIQDVQAALPPSWKIQWHLEDLGGEGVVHNRLHFTILADDEPLLRAEINRHGLIRRIIVYSSRFRTADGLSPGSAFSSLISSRGKLACQGSGDPVHGEFQRHASARAGTMEFRLCVEVPPDGACYGPIGEDNVACGNWYGSNWFRVARGSYDETTVVEGELSVGPIVLWAQDSDMGGATSRTARSFLSRRCAELERCRESGACSVHIWEDGCPGCLPGSDEDCAQSATCLAIGACARGDYRDGVFEFCRPATSEHCRSSARCRTHGECGLLNGVCAPEDPDDCQKAEACSQEGRCALDERGQCAPETAAHCQRSRGCREHGRCFLSHGAYSWARKSCSRTRPRQPPPPPPPPPEIPAEPPDEALGNDDSPENEEEVEPQAEPQVEPKKKKKRRTRKRGKRKKRR